MSESLRGSKLLITIAVMLGSLMAFIDIAIVNVALSDIRASFGTPLDQIGWVSTSYMMANIVVIPLSGWLQRRFGYRLYFTASVALFTLASVLCGLAWDLPSLIVFRAVQGIGGGAIIPTSQAILFLRYPKEQHGTAAALIGLGAITGPLVAPFVGGTVIELANWHWIFLLNVPVGLATMVLAWTSIHQPEFTPVRARIDLLGLGLMVVGLVSLQYVLEEGAREDWFESTHIAVLTIVAIVSLVAFVFNQVSSESPIVNLRLFKSKSYAAASLLNFVIGICVFSGAFMFALYCGTVMRYSALETGILLMKGNVLMLVLMPIAGKLPKIVDGRVLIAGGIVILVCSLWINAHLTADADTTTLLVPLVVRAFGIALVFVPLMAFALSDVAPDQRGNASALFNLTRELGGSMGTAWLCTALDHHARQYAAGLRRHVDPFNEGAVQQFGAVERLLRGRVFDSSAAALKTFELRVMKQALVIAFNSNFFALAFVFVGAIAVVAFLKAPSPDDVSEGGLH
ncbi:MAG TPA: DHA2 family efflux MFS transporter permease subunit [Labilithrix sp.]|nr:DHA2 family efflux MFS transporter permease subunit [Labilithrix sp.]